MIVLLLVASHLTPLPYFGSNYLLSHPYENAPGQAPWTFAFNLSTAKLLKTPWKAIKVFAGKQQQLRPQRSDGRGFCSHLLCPCCLPEFPTWIIITGLSDQKRDRSASLFGCLAAFRVVLAFKESAQMQDGQPTFRALITANCVSLRKMRTRTSLSGPFPWLSHLASVT